MSRQDTHCFLVAYDVPDDRRRSRLATTLKGHGQRVQYSVFMVDCSPAALLYLRHDLEDVMDRDEDSVVMCDLGLAATAQARNIQWLGAAKYQSGSHSIIV